MGGILSGFCLSSKKPIQAETKGKEKTGKGALKDLLALTTFSPLGLFSGNFAKFSSMATIQRDDLDREVIQVSSFDGQTVFASGQKPLFHVGIFLGGGAAGNVYECEHTKSHDHFALKILNPIGYKLLSPLVLRKCSIVSKGDAYNDVSPETEKVPLGKNHVWWLINGGTKQFCASYFSMKQSCLKEFSLTQCIQIWGSNPVSVSEDESGNKDEIVEIVPIPGGARIYVPGVPPKFADFVRKRNRIFREIQNMRKIRAHVNVIRLEGVLELTQESKCTIFLVMELANGGELFDRIKLDCGAREATAKLFFQQVLRGVMHCHNHGVCHRDLKPENLLLQDSNDAKGTTILKIADFGFSARFAKGENDAGCNHLAHNDDWKGGSLSSGQQRTNMPNSTSTSLPDESLLRVLKSVVGSPFYVAPEVLQARGYDGPKADVWSLGVILYAMLAGNLPFEQELSSCKRFRLFCKWVREQTAKGVRFWNDQSVEYPQWLFPAKFSMLAKGLIVAMLHPDPEKRISVSEAMRHPLCSSGLTNNNNNNNLQSNNVTSQQLSSLPVASAAAATTAPAADVLTVGVESGTTLGVPIASAINAGAHSSAISPTYGSSMSSSGSFNGPRSGLTRAIEDMHMTTTLPNMEEEEEGGSDPAVPSSSSEEESAPMDLELDHHDTCESINEKFALRHHSESQDEMRSLTEYGYGLSASGQDIDEDDVMFFMEDENNRSDRGENGQASKFRIPFPITDAGGVVGRPDADGQTAIPNSLGYGSTTTAVSNSVMQVAESPGGTMRYVGSYSPQFEPPVAPMLFTSKSIDDLIATYNVSDNDDNSPGGHSSGDDTSAQARYRQTSGSGSSSSSSHVPTFNDSVKRSTRFITAVPAAEVLSKIESILEQVMDDLFTTFVVGCCLTSFLSFDHVCSSQFRSEKIQTPIGLIGRVEIYWEDYRLEVWGENTSGPPLCELRMYSIPQQAVEATSPARYFLQPTNSSPSPTTYTSYLNSPRSGRDSLPAPLSSLSQQAAGSPFVGIGSIGGRISPLSLGGPMGVAQQPQQLFLAEFVRGQLDIFAFKRWYTVRYNPICSRDLLFSSFSFVSSFTYLCFFSTVSGYVFVFPKSSNGTTRSRALRLGHPQWWMLDFFNVTHLRVSLILV